MTNYKKKLIIGSRASQLAMAQTNDFIDKVLEAYPDMERETIEIKTIKTSGDLNQTSRLDQLGGKGLFAKEIETEISKAQKEIIELKKDSIDSIQKISSEIASNLIQNISGDKLNDSSVKAVVEDVSKKNIGKYL